MLASDPEWSYRFCLLEADIFQFEGRSQDVVDVLDLPTPAFTPRGDLVIKRDILLSLADARLGRQQRSVEEMQAAESFSVATHSSLQGEVLRTQGLLEYRNGEALDAQTSLLASLELARQQKDDYLAASDLLNLGTFALRAWRIDEALNRSNASSLLADKIHADALLQSDLGNAGWAYYDLGDYERALESFQQAEAQARKLGAADSEILWLQSAGQSLSRMGDLRRAQSCYEEALQAAQASHDTARQAESETGLALLFLQLHQLSAARTHADVALVQRRQLEDKPAMEDASLVRALIASAASDPVAEPTLLHILHDDAGMPSVSWTAGDALANLYATRGQRVQAERWYRKSIQVFETQRGSVQEEELRLPFFANGDELYRHYAEFLIATHRSIEALHLLDGARARSLKDALGIRGTGESAAEHATWMPSGRGSDVALFYSLGPQRSYLWVMDRRGTHLIILPAEQEIADRVHRYQESILKSRDPLQDANPDAQWLYDKLVGPAANLIPVNSRVLLVPDGPLNGFNMETLLKNGPQGIHYWIDDVSLTTASSLRRLTHSARQGVALNNTSGRLLLMGDPLPAANGYNSLPSAPAEIEDVERYFPPSRRTTLTGAGAVPDAYAASHPAQYDYLHFVAHGTASSVRPLDSAIILSPAPADPDRFKLYARDIVHQPLHARLVTISACYGSGVRNYAGEGMVGLSWAFLRAGAHQVIAALWEVNDSSTPQLMDQMYRGLAGGARPDQALRAAKLSMLHSQGVFRKPLYWAAFQLYAGS